MGMKLHYAGSGRFVIPHNNEINVTPFVDVMMVLLIVFMVALPVATTSLKLDLPPAKASAPAAPPMVISLQRNGRLFVDGRLTSLETLPGDLSKVVGGSNPQAQHVYVRADRGVSYGAFMGVVNRLHTGGYHKVGLVNEAE